MIDNQCKTLSNLYEHGYSGLTFKKIKEKKGGQIDRRNPKDKLNSLKEGKKKN